MTVTRMLVAPTAMLLTAVAAVAEDAPFAPPKPAWLIHHLKQQVVVGKVHIAFRLDGELRRYRLWGFEGDVLPEQIAEQSGWKPLTAWQTGQARATAELRGVKVRYLACAVSPLMPNGSFERIDPESYWPVGWRVRFKDGSHEVDENVARSGKRSAHIELKFDARYEGGARGYYAGPPYRVRPGMEITLSAELRCRRLAQWAGVSCWYRSDDGTPYLKTPESELMSHGVKGDSDWKRDSLTIVVPEGVAEMTPLALQIGPGESWFDDFAVEGKAPGSLTATTPEVEGITVVDADGRTLISDIPNDYDTRAAALTRKEEWVTSITVPRSRTDTSSWFPFDTRGSGTSAPVDVSYLLDKPAGKHGSVTVGKDGRLRFADGTRARFWGVHISLWDNPLGKEEVAQVAERLSRGGCNLVRLTLDARGQWLSSTSPDNQTFDPERRDLVDYFIAELGKRGIYVYMDLLTCRRFSEKADGVKEAGKLWEGFKVASYFDPRLIELQKTYARDVFTHLNPYTRHRYADDPTIALVELTNENTAFDLVRGGYKFYLPPSYQTDYVRLWNAWLLKRYGDRDRLAKAWTDAAGVCSLQPKEDPITGTVLPPESGARYDAWRAEEARDAGRLHDELEFVADLVTDFYADMHKFLCDLGVRVPITGNNRSFKPIELRTLEGMDFTSFHAYWDHSSPDGAAVPIAFNQPMLKTNPLAPWSGQLPKLAEGMTAAQMETIVRQATTWGHNIVYSMSTNKLRRKPLVVSEWSALFPNEFRCEAIPFVAAYGSMQDWDGFIMHHFCYPRGETLEKGSVASDPAQWGLFGLGATLFLRGDVSVGRHVVQVGYSNTDALCADNWNQDDSPCPQRFLSFITRVENAFFPRKYDGDADAVLASGNSSDADYSAARRAVVWSQSPWLDSHGTRQDRTKLVERTPSAGLLPLPLHEWLYRMFLDAAERWKLLPNGRRLADTSAFNSDTGELTFDYGRGLLMVNGLRTQGAVGFLSEAGEIRLKDVTITARTPFCAIFICSTGGSPLAQAARLVVFTCARAENTNQTVARYPHQLKLLRSGTAPVVVEPVEADVWIRGGPCRGFSLNSRGERQGEVPALRTGGGTKLTLDARWKALHYDLERTGKGDRGVAQATR